MTDKVQLKIATLIRSCDAQCSLEDVSSLQVLETNRLGTGRSKLVMSKPGKEMSTPEKAKSKLETVKNTLVMD
jgi:hypothetical protein